MASRIHASRSTGVDVLLVSLGSTPGLRAADADLARALERAGARVEMEAARPPPRVRTFALTDLVWALAARRAAQIGWRRHRPRAVVYSSITAALLWPRPGAIRFDAPAAANRPGRHGVWQRPVEQRRLREAPLLVPASADALTEAGLDAGAGVVIPIPVEPSGATDGPRDIAALTYAGDPHKKGLDRVLEAWRRVRRDGEELVITGTRQHELSGKRPGEGVRVVGRLAGWQYRALVRRARVFVTAPRREDYGAAQLEALADGCVLVSTPAPGPYAALALARQLDGRLVSEDLGSALRLALDEPPSGYAVRALGLLAPYREAAVARAVAERLLPRLLG